MVTAVDKELKSRGSGEEGEKKANNVVEASAWMSRVTLDIIGLATMGKSFKALEDENSALYQTYKRVLNPSTVGQILAFLGLILPWWLVSNIPVKRNHDVQREWLRSSPMQQYHADER